jgi:chlorobactene glucosyltransferase
LLFLDADVTIKQHVIEKMIAANADIVSCFAGRPYNKLRNYLIDTLPFWQVSTFISLPLANRISDPRYCAANGQCLMIKKSSYKDYHQRLKADLVEDINMARLAKADGLKVKTYFCNHGVEPLPYETFNEGITAFKKNYYPSYPNTGAFIFFQTIIFATFFMPLILMWFNSYFIISTALIAAQRFFQSKLNRQSPINVILHPIQMVIWHYVALASYLDTAKGKREWKGRKY